MLLCPTHNLDSGIISADQLIRVHLVTVHFEGWHQNFEPFTKAFPAFNECVPDHIAQFKQYFVALFTRDKLQNELCEP